MKANAVEKALGAMGSAQVAVSDHATRGFHLNVTVTPEEVVRAAAVLDTEGFFIEAVTGVDWLGEQEALAKEAAKKAAAAQKAAEAAAAEAAEQGGGEEGAASPSEPADEAEAAGQGQEPVEDSFEVVYDFNHFQQLCRVTVRTRVPRGNPELPTISTVYPGADWHEREAHDFFGLIFTGHPDLSPLLLPEDADFHPLRKDYKP